MKRILFIILAVVTVFVVIGLSFAGMGAQRSLNSYGVPMQGFGGGGGGAPEVLMAPVMEEPATASDSSRDAAAS